MAGHSKWKNIKRKKAVTDAHKAKVYTKLIKDITVAARSGGDPDHNPTLRLLLEKARKANMPQENALRAIKRGTGELPGLHYEAHQYEGYGPNGIAVIVEVLTDNKNRAIAEVRNIFSRKGGSISEAGAVNWMFERKGLIRGKGEAITEEMLLESLLDYDVSDIEHEDNQWTITCATQDLEAIKNRLQNLSFIIEDAEPAWIAKTNIDLPSEKEEQAVDFLEALEDLEDVQNVYTNLA
jgi:YebC/PmpR family DNA-binding regulatory protein